jgi:hypothetical protein
MKLLSILTIVFIISGCTKNEEIRTTPERQAELRKILNKIDSDVWPEPKEYIFAELSMSSSNETTLNVINEKSAHENFKQGRFRKFVNERNGRQSKSHVYFKCYEQDFNENGELINLPMEQTRYYKMYHDKLLHPTLDPSKRKPTD